MPTTTKAVNGKDCDIWLDDLNGTLTKLTAMANEVTIKYTQQVGDYNAFSDVSTYRLEGVESIEVEATFIFSKEDTAAVDLLRLWRANKGYRTLQFDIKGHGVVDRYTGEVVYDSLEIPAKVDEAKPINVKVPLKVHGDLPWSRFNG
jgi:hypothetical protein